MPDAISHAAKARDNLAFLTDRGGLVGRNVMWAAVAAHYAAVHLVEQLAAKEQRHNETHGHRELYLSAKHPDLLHHLTALRAASETARYKSINTFLGRFPHDTVQRVLIDINLKSVEDYVNEFLKAGTS